LNLVTYGEPRGNAVVFMEFLKGSRGQEIVREVGFLPVSVAQ
jgi:ABC-type molybdate transport system substrate-binding protein